MLHLGANIRDGYGNSTQGTSTTPCTPAYDLEDNLGPNGPRARLDGNTLTFLTEGPFTVRVHCRENPRISSRGNEAPFNFETSTGTFAKATAEADPPAQAGITPGRVVILIVLAVGLVVVVYELKQVADLNSDPGGGSCPAPSSCLRGDVLCRSDSCGCRRLSRHRPGDPTAAARPLVCTCNATVAAGVAPIHDVEDLVTRGFSSRPPPPILFAAPATAHRHWCVRVGSRSRPRRGRPDARSWSSRRRDRSRRAMPHELRASSRESSTHFPRWWSVHAWPRRGPRPRSRSHLAATIPRDQGRPIAGADELDVRALAFKVAVTAYGIIGAARRSVGAPELDGLAVVPWSQNEAVGLTMLGRF
ncbi:MAG: hypothetical protein IPQ07_40380 [Myxococcales bacterium]|nr:hypothetical protein [Myxococcales bacterium]